MKYFNCVERKNIHIIPGKKMEVEAHELNRLATTKPLLVGAALDANGLNYYDFRETLTGYNYTCVISTNSGVVLNINDDPTIISPGLSQTVFGINEYPEEMTLDRTWRYDFETETFSQDTQAVQRNALVANTAKRDNLQRIATTEAYPLQLRASMGTATPEQLIRLEELNGFIIALDDMTPEQLKQSPASFPAMKGGKN